MKTLAGGGALLLVLILSVPLLFVSTGDNASTGARGPTGPGGGAMPGGNPLPPSALMPVFAAAAHQFGDPEALLLAVAAEESGFHPTAQSSAGAVGLMQMLPATFASWAPRAGESATADPTDPAVEIPVAAAMLAGDGAAHGAIAGALGAYNPEGGAAYIVSVQQRMHDYGNWLGGPLLSGRPAVTGWPHGQCTDYVASERAAMGYPVTWSGDAWQWIGNAAAQGIGTTSLPAVGEIAVYRPGGPYDASYGHVAMVVAVSDSNYRISEMNGPGGLGVVDTQTLAWPDAHLEGFIP
ncbi:MAG: CHAP domain-containing protein [Candidatus Dormibacteraeota bacterium]|nr:CHAP domain-containing protein [Candidatus Dormibacteraeota bacterium]